MTERRAQRRACEECGNRVAVLDDGTLAAHYRGPGRRLRWPNDRRCSGGVVGPTDALLRPPPVRATSPRQPLIPEGRRIRAFRGGLPTLGKRR